MKKQISLKEMEIDVRYIVVTNGSSLKAGDHVWKDKNGDILCGEAQGWLPEEDWKRLRNKVEVDLKYYENSKIKAMEKAVKVDRLIEQYR